MSFIRIKHIKGYAYMYLVQNIRFGGKIKQKVIKYIGKVYNVGTLDKQLVKDIFLRDKFTCQICGSKDDLTIDHKKPIIKNGDGFIMVYGNNDPANLQTLCLSCNSKKSNK